MTETNKTLYIPLYGKAYVSNKGIILQDRKAEEIWAAEGFELGRKSRSKWLAYYMAMRRRVFDKTVADTIKQYPDAVLLHIGCGLDGRYERINADCQWYDIDFDTVIDEKKKYFAENENYHMMTGDATQADSWLHNFPQKNAVVVMEGVSMYLTRQQMQKLVSDLQNHFELTVLLADFYSEFAARMSKYKNPVNEVGATIYSGMDEPQPLLINDRVKFIKETDMTPDSLINQLDKKEQFIFRTVYAGKFAKNLYRMFEYHIKK
ncbi:MAG: class I SAM-dependent methyltransferase [Oscillospiraceae bacterium]|nr:class I SAM-dependent methyltransferase [Oscillospiraceae bacterium]